MIKIQLEKNTILVLQCYSVQIHKFSEKDTEYYP